MPTAISCGESSCAGSARSTPGVYQAANARFYRDYLEGRLDFDAYVRFGLGVLARHEPAALRAWRERFLTEQVRPNIPAAARALLARHRAAGDVLAIVTASNAFITAPIAAELGVPRLIATEAAIDAAGCFTGEPAGLPSFREGKVARVREWLAEDHGADAEALLAEAWFYSDSHNDLPLLERVGRPVAVNADPVLARIATSAAGPRSRCACRVGRRATRHGSRRSMPRSRRRTRPPPPRGAPSVAGPQRASLVLALLALAAAAAFLVALGLGSVATPPGAVWDALLGRGDPLTSSLIVELRLPRALAAFAVGGLLALAGVLMQVLLRTRSPTPMCSACRAAQRWARSPRSRWAWA